MKKFFVIFCFFIFGLSSFAIGADAARLPQSVQPQRPDEWWLQRHQEKLEQVASRKKVDIVMIGDSITHYWERDGSYSYYYGNRHILNLGFGGDRTQNVLYRIHNGEIDGISPKVVTLMIGTNNAHAKEKSEDILLGIQHIVAELRKRLPQSKVLVFSVFPRADGYQQDINKAVNKLLPSIADGKYVFHLDINKNFRDKNNELRPELYYKDMLHLSSAGYLVWAEAMEPTVSKILGDEPVQKDMPRAAIPTPRNGPRHQQKLQEVKQDDYQLLFIGDSITHFFEREGEFGIPVWDKYYKHRNAFNLGFGGDTTDHVIWRMQNGEIDGLNPKVAVLMIGTNNTHVQKDAPEDTLMGIKQIIKALKFRLPNCKILLLSIFPRGEGPDDALRKINEQINHELPGLADNHRVFHLNINESFVDEQRRLSREIMPDFLHPNTKGYEIWAQAMEPVLSKLLNDEPVK